MSGKIKKISIHRPSKKIYNDEMVSHYLAGLIDGDGHISTQFHIVIAFNKRDKKDAIALRTRLGSGQVRDDKTANSVNFVISNPEAVTRIALSIKDKLKHPVKIHQYNTRLVPKFNIPETSTSNKINFDTPWFTGFFEADGHLVTKIVDRRPKKKNKEVRLLAQIDQKDSVLLEQLYIYFKGGYLGYRASQKTYYYSTISFKRMHTVLKFFDKFSLQSAYSYRIYTIMRKAYIMVQNGEHKTELGLKKIEKITGQLKGLRRPEN